MAKSISNFAKLIKNTINEYCNEDGKFIASKDSCRELLKNILMVLKNNGYCDNITKDNWNDIIKFNVFFSKDQRSCTIVAGIRKVPDKAVLSEPVSNDDIMKLYEYYASLSVDVLMREDIEPQIQPKVEEEEEVIEEPTEETTDTSLTKEDMVSRITDAYVKFINVMNSITEYNAGTIAVIHTAFYSIAKEIDTYNDMFDFGIKGTYEIEISTQQRSKVMVSIELSYDDILLSYSKYIG